MNMAVIKKEKKKMRPRKLQFHEVSLIVSWEHLQKEGNNKRRTESNKTEKKITLKRIMKSKLFGKD